MSTARLVTVREPAAPEGVVIVLHGGASRRGQMKVSPAQLSVLRMIPVARRIARSGRGRLAVYRLLNSYRGWDTRHTPVHDAAWAVEQVAERHGADVPVCMVGHSLGGRASILASSLPQVRGVVALAAFVYPSDADGRGIRGRQILFVHGLLDRIAPAQRARQLAERLAVANRVGFVAVARGKHAMLAQHRTFERTAVDFVGMLLLDAAPSTVVGVAMDGGRVVQVD
ncbi:alpha/beta hydrolase [Nocardioides caeni]|uniref:Alpha/beta hydrolase n=1 Tax=Nocardioides caeni TaxID=574700 RepID=A0A4S8N6K6_9ACTN|nr:alpha/beta hydrolase [Nocardioides caeni]THV11231.1 alpha/beta hydrolase [Nocardioides caeni]